MVYTKKKPFPLSIYQCGFGSHCEINWICFKIDVVSRGTFTNTVTIDDDNITWYSGFHKLVLEEDTFRYDGDRYKPVKICVFVNSIFYIYFALVTIQIADLYIVYLHRNASSSKNQFMTGIAVLRVIYYHRQ